MSNNAVACLVLVGPALLLCSAFLCWHVAEASREYRKVKSKCRLSAFKPYFAPAASGSTRLRLY